MAAKPLKHLQHATCLQLYIQLCDHCNRVGNFAIVAESYWIEQELEIMKTVNVVAVNDKLCTL